MNPNSIDALFNSIKHNLQNKMPPPSQSIFGRVGQVLVIFGVLFFLLCADGYDMTVKLFKILWLICKGIFYGIHNLFKIVGTYLLLCTLCVVIFAIVGVARLMPPRTPTNKP